MDNLELKVGADVSEVAAGGKQVDRSLEHMERTAANLKRSFEALGSVSNKALNQLRKDADAAFRSLEKLKTGGGGSAADVTKQLKGVQMQMLGAGASLLRQDRSATMPGLAGGPGASAAAGVAAAASNRSAGRGMLGGGAFGRMVSGNLLSMGLGFGVYGAARFASQSMQEAGSEREADARVRHQFDRQKLSPAALNATQGNAMLLNHATGKNVGDIETLISRAMLGTSDVGNATRTAKLGMDIDAGGGGISASQLVDAVNSAQSGDKEGIDKLRSIARTSGIGVDDGETANSVLQKLSGRYGGLSEETYQARGGIGRLSNSVDRVKVALGNRLEPAAGIVAGAVEGSRNELIDMAQYAAWAVSKAVLPGSQDASDYASTMFERYKTQMRSDRFEGGAPTVDEDVTMQRSKGKTLKPASSQPRTKIEVRTVHTFRNDPNAPTQMTARGMH
jgi:hypothetical protein